REPPPAREDRSPLPRPIPDQRRGGQHAGVRPGVRLQARPADGEEARGDMPHLVRPLPWSRRVRAASVACGIALSLAVAPPCGAAEPAASVAPAVPHDRAFWHAIKTADFAVPQGASAAALVEELT